MGARGAMGARLGAIGARGALGAGILAVALLCSSLWAQGRGGVASFPAQQRDPADPAVVARGRAIYDTDCRSCHGADLRGGEQGGSNLLRATPVLNDREGELIQPVLQASHKGRIPAAGLSADEMKALAAYIHSILALAPGQGAPPPPPAAARAQGARRRRRRRRAIFRGEVRELPLGDRRSQGHRRARSRSARSCRISGLPADEEAAAAEGAVRRPRLHRRRR